MITRHHLGLILRTFFATIGVAFLAVAFRETWNLSREQVLPGWWHLAGAQALVVVALAAASRGWVVLFEGQGRARGLAKGFYTAQVGKYVPGMIWQAVGQIGLARQADVSISRATMSFPVHAVTQVAAGGAVGSALTLFGSNLGAAPRLAPLLGLVLMLPLDRRWMSRVVTIAERWLGERVDREALPSQRAILHSFAWATFTLVASGAAFDLLASSLPLGSPALAGIPAFALAWTVGFLAVPFPAGLGVREAVLIAAMGGSAAAVIAASLAHRLVSMLGEVVMIGVSRVRSGRSRS